MNRIAVARELVKLARELSAIDRHIGGHTFRYLSRGQGDLIVLVGKPGYVWSSLEGKEQDANSGPGVYHSDGDFPNEKHRLLPGVDPLEFKKAFNL
jgi:hypothetical protein